MQPQLTVTRFRTLINASSLAAALAACCLLGCEPGSGIDGAAGPAGANGVDGVAGPQGIQGPKGDKGDTGATGAAGADGAAGAKGDKGDNRAVKLPLNPNLQALN